MPTRRARSRNYVVYRTGANKFAEAASLPVYLARRRRKIDAADADADEYNKDGKVLEADTESQKRRKTEDAVAATNVAEDVRMESDSGAFLVGPCNGETPEDGNEDYDEYNVENDDSHYEERLEDEEDLLITTTMIRHQQKQLVSMVHHYIYHQMTFKISILLI